MLICVADMKVSLTAQSLSSQEPFGSCELLPIIHWWQSKKMKSLVCLGEQSCTQKRHLLLGCPAAGDGSLREGQTFWEPPHVPARPLGAELCPHLIEVSLLLSLWFWSKNKFM